MKYLPHNRQLPLAQTYEKQILREELKAREKIIAEQCLAATARHKAGSNARIHRALHPSAPEPIVAEIVIHIATHSKNPGPGSWGATIVTKDGLSKESEWYPHLPQPLLELEAMIAILNVIDDQPGTVAIHTTARWIAEYLNDGRAEKWQANQWRKSSGDPIKHAESWAELLRLCTERKAAVAWLGHNATPEMKQAHGAAKRAFLEKR